MPQFDVPILLLIFNRPESTKIVFDKIKQIQPRKLFVASDGPRNYDESIIVNQTRSFIEKSVDWPCELKILYHDSNLGCGLAVGEAITWAFKESSYLIIIEDDCVPSLSFFSFCRDLLEKYIDDERIWVITGLNHFNGEYNLNPDDSYFFSKYSSIWGWATWKRVWNKVDLRMTDWTKFRDQGYIFDHVSREDGKIAWEQYNNFFENQIVNKERLSNWDTQLGFTIWSNRGVGITPSQNLISNIGTLGTHSSKKMILHNIEITEIFHITKHPDFFQTNYLYDDHYYNLFRKKKSLIRKFISKVKNIFNRNS